MSAFDVPRLDHVRADLLAAIATTDPADLASTEGIEPTPLQATLYRWVDRLRYGRSRDEDWLRGNCESMIDRLIKLAQDGARGPWYAIVLVQFRRSLA